MRWTVLAPLGVFLILCGLFIVRLTNDAPLDEVPSALIGRPAPALALTPIKTIETAHLSSDAIGERDVMVLNVWASWCAPCQVEHPQIEALSKIDGVTMAGLNYKDKPENAAKFLNALGNPFDYIGGDMEGKVSLQYGVYGVPETFIIDKNGIIRAKYIGEVTPDILEKRIKPLIKKIQAES